MTFRTHRRVEFRDTDAAGIVHFSAFFPMMESAEHEMLRSLGLSVMPREKSADDRSPPGDFDVTWPRVAASCSYNAAARFEDLLQIDVDLAHIGKTSVQYRFAFSRDGQAIAEGEITAVCCRLPTDHSSGGLEKVAIPDEIRRILSSPS